MNAETYKKILELIWENHKKMVRLVGEDKALQITRAWIEALDKTRV